MATPSTGNPKDFSYTILYFQGQGLAELPRNLLRASGLTWKNEFVDQQTLPAHKPNLLFGQVPKLIVEHNGNKVFELVQSRAIVHYLATLTKFYGTSLEEAAQIDQFYEGIRDTIEPISRAWWPAEDKKKAFADHLATGKLQQNLAIFNDAIGKNPSGYLVGNSPSYADIAFYSFVEDIEILAGKEFLNAYPNALALREKIANLPGIKENHSDPNRITSFYAKFQ